MVSTTFSAIYTAEQVRAIDQRMITAGTPGFVLMERAARAAWAVLHARWPECRELIVVCGSGNNGGDGFLLAAIARAKGVDVQVYCSRPVVELNGDALRAAQHAEAAGIVLNNTDVLLASSHHYRADTVIVDALLGIGFTGIPSSRYVQLITWMNTTSYPVFALDIVSGLDANTGSMALTSKNSDISNNEMPCAVHADATISFIGIKRGTLTGEGRELSGELYLDTLDIEPPMFKGATVDGERLHAAHLIHRLQRRNNDHKGSFGHVAIVGGDTGFGGAAILASEAAARSGAGTVSLHTRSQHISAALMRVPEVMATELESVGEEVLHLLRRASVIAVGPGMGKASWARVICREIMQLPQAKVIDADALNLIAVEPEILVRSDLHVFTPHPGEAARLLDVSVSDIQADRFHAARRLQQLLGGVVVLKGAGTIIQSADTYHVCTDGNPGMAVGGMGDVLAGVIAAFLAQGIGPFEAAQLGVWLHSRAADTLAQEQGMIGMLASDVIPKIRYLLHATHH